MAEAKTGDIWTELRKPFDKKVIGQLPKPTKKDNVKGKCTVCGGWHGLPAVHLDYVGHAAVTDRLNSVDPTWTWEPMATSENGLPLADSAGNLWIKLTVGGVTRPGVGDGDSMKEKIGDALRNAAMRFGVALDLWSKEELESHIEEPELKNEKPSAKQTIDPPAPEEPSVQIEHIETLTKEHITDLMGMAKAKGADTRDAAKEYLNALALIEDFTKLPDSMFVKLRTALLETKVGEA